MEIQTAYRTEARTHKSFMKFYRIEMLSRCIVDADAMIRGATKTKVYFSLIQQNTRNIVIKIE